MEPNKDTSTNPKGKGKLVDTEGEGRSPFGGMVTIAVGQKCVASKSPPEPEPRPGPSRAWHESDTAQSSSSQMVQAGPSTEVARTTEVRSRISISDLLAPDPAERLMWVCCKCLAKRHWFMVEMSDKICHHCEKHVRCEPGCLIRSKNSPRMLWIMRQEQDLVRVPWLKGPQGWTAESLEGNNPDPREYPNWYCCKCFEAGRLEAADTPINVGSCYRTLRKGISDRHKHQPCDQCRSSPFTKDPCRWYCCHCRRNNHPEAQEPQEGVRCGHMYESSENSGYKCSHLRLGCKTCTDNIEQWED